MKLFSILIILAIILVIPAVYAEVQYPVQELGGCASQQDCEKYCDNIQNIEECINFAEKAGMMTKEQIDEARKMLPYLKAGETPGKCTSEKQCDEYCNKDENLQECISFAEKTGMITGEELAMINKTGGKGPGNCKGKKQCDDYCNDESHFSECVDFAVANGLMDASEAEIVKKTGGKGPGNCKSKEECDAFCNNEANIATCVDFAVANGMMDAKDAEMVKKTGGKGPGNCKSKEECDAFCNNPDNQETCMNFAIEHGLMSEEELANMKKNQEFIDSSEGKCFMQCMRDAGVDSKNCGENGAGPEACKTCSEKCYPHDKTSGGRCLSQEKWQQLDTDCKAKGSGYHLEEVKGEDGRGGECVIDETCVYGEGKEWENQAEKDRQLAEMQKQWDEEKAQYESENGPGGQEELYTGGCTQPGPEGQCNPGPGAQPSDEGGSSEENNPVNQEQQQTQIPQQQQQEQAPQQEQQSSPPPQSGEGSGGGQAGVTGMVIMKSNTNSNGIIPRLIEEIRNLF